jgi:hypothetical protein
MDCPIWLKPETCLAQASFDRRAVASEMGAEVFHNWFISLGIAGEVINQHRH